MVVVVGGEGSTGGREEGRGVSETDAAVVVPQIERTRG